ncbi:hypothetical protein KAS79_01285 [Candidatus Parcubacteria bacterium]|nr:hypothetical protein [Candidatus Parcubacteria bacterium]
MTNFDQKKFDEFVIKQDVIGFPKEPIKLKSGRISNWYVNWRNVAEDVWLINKLADHVIAFVENRGLSPHCFYGVPEGATKLGTTTQSRWAEKQIDYGPGAYPLPMGRGKPKEDHGDPKDIYFVGMPKGKTIILEDVTTTGESLLKTIDKLLEIEATVIAAIVLTNRNEIGNRGKSVEAVRDKGIPYYTMSNALDLLPLAYEKLQPGEDVAKLVEKYFDKYGIEPIKLIK